MKQYFEDGFLVVPNFFAPEELAPVCEAVDECVDVLANRLYDGGKIADKCKDAGFYKRLTLLEKQFKGTAVLLHKMVRRKKEKAPSYVKALLWPMTHKASFIKL